LHGFTYIPVSIGLECLLFPTRWFTLSLQDSKRRLSAVAQLHQDYQGGCFQWMMMTDRVNENTIPRFLETLTTEASQRKYAFLTTSIDQDSDLIDPFILNGFVTIGWEQAWKYQHTDFIKTHDDRDWRLTTPTDNSSINQISNKNLSPAEKSITPSVIQNPPPFSFFIKNELHGYAYIKKNNKTVVVIPFFSPTVLSPALATKQLLDYFYTDNMLLYIILKSGSKWSDSFLLEHYKMASSKRVRMVKHLAIKIKDFESERSRVANGSTTDLLTPLSKSNAFKDKI